MVKLLKFVLFLVVMVFSFALGVKFSDSFKGNVSNSSEAVSVQDEMNGAFDPKSVEGQNGAEVQDANPVTDQERQDVENAAVPGYVDGQPVDNQNMDNLDEVDTEASAQNAGNVPVAPAQVAPTAPTAPAQVAPVAPVAPTAPAQVAPVAPTAGVRK